MRKSKAFRLLSWIAFVVSGMFALLTGLLFLDGNNAHGAMGGIAALSAFATIASALVGGLFRLYG
jgi:hypothetical protein